MNGKEIVLWSLFCQLLVFRVFVAAEENSTDFSSLRSKSQQFQDPTKIDTETVDVVPGIKLCLTDKSLSINVKIIDLIVNEGNRTEERTYGGSKKPLKKIGMMMMMAPFLMQLLSLPGTIASIKFSLLRSLVVGKLAILMMLYSLFKNSQNSEVVVIHHSQHHKHYYQDYHHSEDDDHGWLV